MITAGIDMGSKFVKTVILKDGSVLGKASEAVRFEPIAAAEKCFKRAVNEAGLDSSAIDHITSTGAGRKSVPNVNSDIRRRGPLLMSAPRKGVA